MCCSAPFSVHYTFFSYLYLCSALTLKTVLQNIVPLQNYSDSIGDELPAGLSLQSCRCSEDLRSAEDPKEDIYTH